MAHNPDNKKNCSRKQGPDPLTLPARQLLPKLSHQNGLDTAFPSVNTHAICGAVGA